MPTDFFWTRDRAIRRRWQVCCHCTDQVPPDAILCGGATVYDLLLEQCDEILATTVKKEVEGDTFFNFQWLENFSADETLEETDEFSMVAYKRTST